MKIKQTSSSFALAVVTSIWLLLTSTGCTPQRTKLPVIQVDHQHSLQREGSKPYLIAPAKELILGINGYKFDSSQYQEKNLTPNYIEVVIFAENQAIAKESGVYRVDWNSGTEAYRLNSTTLVPTGEAPPFTQFESGQQVLITIGHLKKAEASREEVYSFWSTLINVQ